MPEFSIAHIREQGQDVIIVPMANTFYLRPEHEKHAALAELQLRARAADLAGTAGLVWQDPSGRTQFLASPLHRLYYQTLSFDAVVAACNRTLRS